VETSKGDNYKMYGRYKKEKVLQKDIGRYYVNNLEDK
jgi:hypothetical protein